MKQEQAGRYDQGLENIILSFLFCGVSDVKFRFDCFNLTLAFFLYVFLFLFFFLLCFMMIALFSNNFSPARFPALSFVSADHRV